MNEKASVKCFKPSQWITAEFLSADEIERSYKPESTLRLTDQWI